ncbi:MAG: hypothetical protein ACK5UC_27795 [Planctomycetaceae bacterium]|jgi:hypothetical protein
MFESLDLVESFTKGFWQSLIEQVTALVIRLFCGRPHAEATSASLASSPQVDSAEPRLRELLGLLLPKLRTNDDWNSLRQSLEQFGARFDDSARVELAALQREVLERVAQPAAAASRLEQLTADAFRRAGIAPTDVAAGQRLAQTLADETPADTPAAPAAPGTRVAELALPWKWWTLSQAEIDRRTRQVLVRRLRSARLAGEQAAGLVSALVPLRQLRALAERFDLVLLQLQSIPPLEIETPGLRLDGFQTKTLLTSLDAAAQASTGLLKSLNTLLSASPGSDDWNRSHTAVVRDLELVAQQVRERRELR